MLIIRLFSDLSPFRGTDNGSTIGVKGHEAVGSGTKR